MLAALKKPVRVLSISYSCLLSPIVRAESTLRLVNALLSLNSLSLEEKSVLNRYKEVLEHLHRHVSVKKSGEIVVNQKAIAKGLEKFKASLSEQDFAILKLILKSDEAKSRNIDVSDIVMKYNAQFLENLRDESSQYSKTIVFVSTDRQSSYIDKFLAHSEDLIYSGHALQAIPHIANRLHAHYDPMLLSNVFPGDGGRGVIDKDGVLSLYYQSHKVALQYPEAPVEFQVYGKDTHAGLRSALKACSQVLAKGSVLQLRKYAREKVTQLLKTRGKAVPDSYYARTISQVIEGSAMRISEQGPVRLIAIGKERADIQPTQLRHLVSEALKQRPPMVQTSRVWQPVLGNKAYSSRPIPGAR